MVSNPQPATCPGPHPAFLAGHDRPGIDTSEHVVLLDPRGRAVGTMAKSEVHHTATPLHLAFSCHVVRPDGSTLITRRSSRKATWPGVWSNACCGHPRLGESLRQAVRRHAETELGCDLGRIAVAIGDFAYRARMPDGTTEHELCPVVVAEIDGSMQLNPAEADAARWLPWTELHRRARDRPDSLSPWVVAQLSRLPPDAAGVYELLGGGPGPASAVDLLDAPVTLAPPAGPGPGRGWHRAAGPPPAPRPGPAVPAPGPSPSDRFDTAVAPVEVILSSFLAERLGELTAIEPTATDLGRAVSDLVGGGGKRLRPAFVTWGWRAARREVRYRSPADADLDRRPDQGENDVEPGDDEHGAHVLGAAVELLHTFALLHDDVMDRATTRRGLPTARTAFTEDHRAVRSRGDAALFGDNAAILAGDLAFVWADQLLDDLVAPPAAIRAVRSVFNHLRREVVAGQYLDLVAGSAPLASAPPGPGREDGALTAHPNGEESAVVVALLKSARYTVTRPLQLGAALGGPLPQTSPTHRALAAYGDAIGLAFQMRDDVLDLFGDPEATGKGSCGDLREGKRTVLLERTLRLADPDEVGLLLGAVGDPDLSDATAARCREVVARSGALASVEAMIAEQHRRAVGALEAIDDAEVRRALADLAELAVDRAS